MQFGKDTSLRCSQSAPSSRYCTLKVETFRHAGRPLTQSNYINIVSVQLSS